MKTWRVERRIWIWIGIGVVFFMLVGYLGNVTFQCYAGEYIQEHWTEEKPQQFDAREIDYAPLEREDHGGVDFVGFLQPRHGLYGKFMVRGEEGKRYVWLSNSSQSKDKERYIFSAMITRSELLFEPAIDPDGEFWNVEDSEFVAVYVLDSDEDNFRRFNNGLFSVTQSIDMAIWKLKLLGHKLREY